MSNEQTTTPWTPTGTPWAFVPEKLELWNDKLTRVAGRSPKIIAADGTGIAKVYDEANARLIAAAPELYEALDGLIKELDDPSRNMKRMQSRYERARVALAKARGESA